MKYVRCDNHFEAWEEFVGQPLHLGNILAHFRSEESPALIFESEPGHGHGYWMVRKQIRSLKLDEFQICYYCGKPCWHRQWARMETLSSHFDGVHRQYHSKCERKRTHEAEHTPTTPGKICLLCMDLGWTPKF